MSRLVSLIIEDFMGYEYGEIHFDDSNIISLKGYNSNGKTTVLRSLGVLLSDSWAMRQSKFIRHNKNKFRITANFDDGVSIVREKFASGKSSYQMYQDGEEVFSTIQNGVYTSTKGVPEFVSRYLNLIDDTSINLHLRRGRDKLLLVDTTGRENYEFLSSALKAEEISTASAMLKSDRLQVKSDVSAIEYEIHSYKKQVQKDVVVTPRLVETLEEVDKKLDIDENKVARLESLFKGIEKYNQIKPNANLETVNVSKVKGLLSIFKMLESYNQIKVSANLESINTDKVRRLGSIFKKIEDYNRFQPTVSLEQVDFTKYNKLTSIWKTANQLSSIESKIQTTNNEIAEMQDQLNQMEKWVQEQNVQVYTCKNCGTLQVVGEGHGH